jgi:hypothetical protein
MNIVDHAWMGARPAAPGEPIQDRRLIAVTSTGVLLVFSKEGEGLLGDVAGLSLAGVVEPSSAAAGDKNADTLKEKPSKFDVRTIIRCTMPRGVEARSIVAYGKVGRDAQCAAAAPLLLPRTLCTLLTRALCCMCVALCAAASSFASRVALVSCVVHFVLPVATVLMTCSGVVVPCHPLCTLTPRRCCSVPARVSPSAARLASSACTRRPTTSASLLSTSRL